MHACVQDLELKTPMDCLADPSILRTWALRYITPLMAALKRCSQEGAEGAEGEAAASSGAGAGSVGSAGSSASCSAAPVSVWRGILPPDVKARMAKALLCACVADMVPAALAAETGAGAGASGMLLLAHAYEHVDWAFEDCREAVEKVRVGQGAHCQACNTGCSGSCSAPCISVLHSMAACDPGGGYTLLHDVPQWS